MISRASSRQCSIRILFLLMLVPFMSASCTEYWWTRGQPPAVGTLVNRSKEKLLAARKERGKQRQEIAEISEKLEVALLGALSSMERRAGGELPALFDTAVEQFISLEGKLSVGSRAALGELSAQLRSFQSEAQGGGQPNAPAFGLFTARTLSFLANELSMPAPVVG